MSLLLFGSTTPQVVETDPQTARYVLSVVDRDGEVLDTLPGVRIEEFSYVLNGPGSLKVRIPFGTQGLGEFEVNGEPDTGYPWLKLTRDQLRVFSNAFPDEWDPDPTRRTFTLEAPDPIAHFERMVFGDAERVNYATNGGFEAASTPTSWTATGGATLSIVTDSPARGARALRVAGGSGQPTANQVVTLPVGDENLVWQVSAWYRVDTVPSFIPSFKVTRIYDGGGPGNTQDFWNEPLNEDEIVADRWTRLTSPPIPVTAGRDGQLSVHLLDGAGTVEWDEVRVSRNDNTGSPSGDPSTLLSTMFGYGISLGDLAIDKKVWLTGETIGAYRYLHAEHDYILPSCDEWLAWCDYRFNHRLNRLEIGPSSKIGRVRTDMALGTRPDGGTFGGAFRPGSVSGRDKVTSAIAIGNAADPITREEAGYTDPTAEVVWQTVVDAPDNATLAELDALPRKTVEQLAAPGGVQTVELVAPPGGRSPADWLSRGLMVGDKFRENIDHDPFRYSAVYRITKLTCRPADGDKLIAEVVRYA